MLRGTTGPAAQQLKARRHGKNDRHRPDGKGMSAPRKNRGFDGEETR
jgi:hypothetical protein